MAKNRSALRNRLEYGAYLAARTVAGTVSPAALARIGDALGTVYSLVGGERRRVLRYNLSHALPELDPAARRRLGRAVARHFARVTLDALRHRRLRPEELLAEVNVVGREHLERAMAEGRGGFVLSAHIGAWEVAALVAGLLLPQGLAVVNRPLDNPLLEAELARLRGLYGNRSLGKRGVARDILRELKAGGVVGILIDQRARKDDAVSAPMFGLPSRTHPILARLALRTGAPVVPLWGLWDGPGRTTVRFDPQVDPQPGDDEVALTARYNQAIEAVIRERPEQWLWYHDRWRPLRVGESPGSGSGSGSGSREGES
jgi:KDO2-lipid IV(A) lauroyltransferase